MKNKWQLFSFFMLFILVNGFGQQNSGNYNDDVLERLEKIEGMLYSIVGGTAPQGSLIPLTFDIVNDISKSTESNALFKKLDYYLSRDLTLTTMPARKVSANAGRLVIDNGKTVEVRLPVANPGEYVGFDSKTQDEIFLTIKFPGIAQALRFVMDPKTNMFYFDAVDNSQASFEGSIPYLNVIGSYNGDNIRETDLPASGTSRKNMPSQDKKNTGQTLETFQASNTGHSRFIVDDRSITREGVIAYASSKKSGGLNGKDKEIIEAYFNISYTEGVNADIAIAQMLHATGNFTNQTRIDANNFAGFSSTPGWSGKFNSINDGVSAHVQHLKFYATSDYRPRNTIDPRYEVILSNGYVGRIHTFEQLYRCWVDRPGYGDDIDNILNDLYRYSSVSRY
jgi:hypothetical protein